MSFRRVCVMVYFSITHIVCQRCSLNKEVDISDGESYSMDSIKHNNFIYAPETFFKGDDERTIGCICNATTCINKCCPVGYMFIEGVCEKNESVVTIDVYLETNLFDDGQPFISPIFPCPGPKIQLDPDTFGEGDTYYVQRDGTLFMPLGSNLTHSEYCAENTLQNGNVSSSVFMCLEGKKIETNIITSYGMIISMPFLLATFLAYALLPDRNLPAKALMCYVLSLLLAYILLVTIQLSNNMANGPCVASAILCYFFFMVSFFWMNSSCIDIWLTFSGLKGLVGNRKQNENKRFVYYFIYSWGVPIILVCIVIGMTYGPHITKASQFHTGLGEGQCWFKSELPTGIYFYFPIALLLIINVILFAVTAYKINVVKKDTKMLKQGDSRAHRYENDKQRFNLYLKLLLAMGLNWTMEVISWAVNWGISSTPEAVWYLTDLCNALYGVFIFFIFVFKRNIWMLLKKRYLQLTGKPQQAHQLGISSSTARTAVSQVTSEA